MQRRHFIILLGGTAVGWPLAVRAQQGERMRRIGVLLPATSDDARFQTAEEFDWRTLIDIDAI